MKNFGVLLFSILAVLAGVTIAAVLIIKKRQDNLVEFDDFDDYEDFDIPVDGDENVSNYFENNDEESILAQENDK